VADALQAEFTDVAVAPDASECGGEHLAADDPVVSGDEITRSLRWVTSSGQNCRIDVQRIETFAAFAGQTIG
jgi:hypothetical protein